jgi:PAS domain S-box-containing protein
MLIKILFVGDSASSMLIVEKLICEHCILTACSGAEAMRLLGEHRDINLLILDLKLPDKNGLQVLRTLKRDKRYNNLHKIILADCDDEDSEIKSFKLGAADYIRKPAQPDLLLARLEAHIAIVCAQEELVKKLRKISDAYEMLINQVPVGIAISFNKGPSSSISNEHFTINAELERITGRTKEELLALGWVSITHPDDVDENMRYYEKLQAGEIDSYAMDKRFIRPDGSVVWVYMIVKKLVLDENYSYNHVAIFKDITERKIVEKQLSESERSKSTLLSHLPGMAYRCKYDRDWTIEYVSSGCVKLTGYTPENLINNRDLSYNDIIAPEYQEVLWNEWERILKGRQDFRYEYEIITASGERKWVLELGQGVFDENGEVEALEGIIIDISDRKAVEDALKYTNEHDNLTGLYNREYLESLLKKDAGKYKKIKRAFVGINLSTIQILTVNYGYNYTQDLIIKVAETLCKYRRDNCELFRTHENRFLFYMKNYKDKNELFEFSESIADELQALFITDRVGGGIGILELGADESDMNLLSRKLLIASERAINLFDKEFKACFYDAELEAIVDREAVIRHELARVAADDSCCDLFVQYQPILDLKTNSICGFEALARLYTDKLGLVSPAEFIPIAEETKLIVPIGEKVFIAAFRFINRLKECGFDDINVSVNISAIQLLRPEFIDRLMDLIREINVNPANIGIEITESIFAADYTFINNIISKLKDTGIHIAIDDFGTGYSSLAREKELNVNSMKIDKYFIDKLLEEDDEKAITGDIISIAHRLGHSTIAEGVEREEQKQYLIAHGCDKIQGYLISRPLDEDDAIKLLKKHRSKKM